MNRTLGLILAAALAIGCKPTATKMAALPTAPPIFQVIPAGTNPNTLKIPGAQGTFVQNSGGGNSWVMGTGGVWQTYPGPNTADGGVPLSAPIANASLATMAGQTVKGNAGADAGVPADLTKAQFTALVNAATPSTAGLMPAASFVNLSAMPADWEVASIITPKIDFTTQATTTAVIPAKPGYYYLSFSSGRIVFTDIAGTFTGAPSWRAGNDAGNVNVVAQIAGSPTTAQLNAGVVPMQLATNGPNPGTTLVDLTTAVSLVVSAATTGGTTLRGRVMFFGFYVPASYFAPG